MDHALYGLPPKQGLYDPSFEKDACGVGFVVSIDGKRSSKVVPTKYFDLNEFQYHFINYMCPS